MLLKTELSKQDRLFSDTWLVAAGPSGKEGQFQPCFYRWASKPLQLAVTYSFSAGTGIYLASGSHAYRNYASACKSLQSMHRAGNHLKTLVAGSYWKFIWVSFKVKLQNIFMYLFSCC